MKNLKEIIETCNFEANFTLFDDIVTISKERNIMSNILNKFSVIADSSKELFEFTINEYTRIEDFFEEIFDVFITIAMDAINEVSRDAMSIGCYTYDANYVIKLSVENNYFKSFEIVIGEFLKKYEKIISKYQGRISVVSENAENHPRLEVATIGGNISDVISNQFKADITNIIIGEISNIVAEKEKSNIYKKVEKEIKALFNDKAFRNDLSESMRNYILNLPFIYINKLDKEYNLGVNGLASNEDKTRADAIYNNLISFELTIDEQKRLVKEILELNPFKQDYYYGILSKFFDNTKEIKSITDFLKINIDHYIEQILEDMVNEYLGELNNSLTIDDIKYCQQLINSKIEQLCLPSKIGDNSYFSIEKYTCKYILLYLEKCMKNNTVKCRSDAIDILGEAKKIASELKLSNPEFNEKVFEPFYDLINIYEEQTLEELKELVNNNIGQSEKDALECRKELSQKCKELMLEEKKAYSLFSIIDDRLKNIDEKERTIEGFLFPTRATANNIKNIIDMNKEILYSDEKEFITRNDYLENIKKIKQIPFPIDKITNHFIGKYETFLKEFDRKCKIAKVYDNKINGKRNSLKEKIFISTISEDKQFSIWKEVTHDGKYKISFIMGISENC